MELTSYLRTIFVGYFEGAIHFSHHPGRSFCGRPFLVRLQNFYEALREDGPPQDAPICDNCLDIFQMEVRPLE